LGNYSRRFVPHGAYRCHGDDDWIAVVAASDAEWQRLCAVIPGLPPMAEFGFHARLEHRGAIDQKLSAWVRPQAAKAAAAELLQAGVPAAALCTALDLVECHHLNNRGFWDAHGPGVLPGLPWRSSFAANSRPAPELGADTEGVLRDVLGLSPGEIANLWGS